MERTNASDASATVPSCDDPLISVVIVTFHSADVVVGCIERIVANTDPIETPYEIIVVDNVDDGRHELQPSPVIDVLRRRTRGLLLLPAPINTGFGGGNNIGAAVARSRYLCLCNPDVRVAQGWARPLVDQLQDPRVGIAAPVLVNPDGSPQEFGQVLLNTGLTLAVGGPDLFPGDWALAIPRDVDYASAAFWMVPRVIFHEVGGFDPTFHPAYWEDVDLALRLDQHGLTTRLVPEVRVTHVKGGSSPASLPAAQRSHTRFIAKWTQRLIEQPSHPRSLAEQLAAVEHAERRSGSAARQRVAPLSRLPDSEHD